MYIRTYIPGCHALGMSLVTLNFLGITVRNMVCYGNFASMTTLTMVRGINAHAHSYYIHERLTMQMVISEGPGEKKMGGIFLEKISFEPDSNQRPMDDYTSTVHRSTN